MDSAQKNWLLETFFKNEDFAGWRNIAEKLIDTGKCVTTNQGEKIWIGGIGNFIDSQPFEGGVDLIQLTFNIKDFVSFDNKFFMEAYNHELNKVKEKQQELIDYSNSITTLTSF